MTELRFNGIFSLFEMAKKGRGNEADNYCWQHVMRLVYGIWGYCLLALLINGIWDICVNNHGDMGYSN